MKSIILSFAIILFCFDDYAQIPLTDIQGRLWVSLPEHSTSLHIGKEAGKMQDLKSLRFNTFVGTGAGESTQLGNFNSFFGKDVRKLNQDGYQNCYYGVDAGKENQLGHSNAFYGYASAAIS